MNTAIAMACALAAAVVATGCGKADAPTGPVAALNAPSAMSPDSSPTPPVTKAPEVTLPPLPSNITAAPELPTEAPKAQDTAANNPKGDLTPAEEQNSMPKAAQANNHSSTALDDKTPK
jgi:hypothetical protein